MNSALELFVACGNPETCLELAIPGGFDSPFWKAMGYKYNQTTHPECLYYPCDHTKYPQKDPKGTVYNVSGFSGVNLYKYGKPPAAAALDFDSVTFANANRARIVQSVREDPHSTWTATSLPAPRFVDTPYSTLRTLGGVLGGDPTENRAGLPIKTLRDIQLRSGLRSSAMPAAFDSRANWPECASTIGEIRDQSACGSCYAVSGASAASDRYCIAKEGKTLPSDRLSGVDLMSCCKTCAGGNGGCDGGTPSACWDYMSSQGIASGGAYGDYSNCLEYPFPECAHHEASSKPVCPPTPYNAPTCWWACDRNTTSKTSYDASQATHKFGSSYKVEGNVAAIQMEIAAHGPVQASMFLLPAFEIYKSGVFQSTSTKWIGAHAVKIVGWGIDNTTAATPYWRVQNSWNTDWGEDGYFRILRGSNMMSIEGGVVAGTMAKW